LHAARVLSSLKELKTTEYFALDVFLRDRDRVFLTSATTSRGAEVLGSEAAA
jgi:hypothetical protein